MTKYKKIRLNKNEVIDEHRLIMQNHLGRKLNRNEVVHHKNGNGRDNRLENLELMSLSEHSRKHRAGHSSNNKINWPKGKAWCFACKKFKTISNFPPSKSVLRSKECRKCNTKFNASRRNKNDKLSEKSSKGATL